MRSTIAWRASADEADQRFNHLLAMAGVPDEQRIRLVLEVTPCLPSSLPAQCQGNAIGRLLVASFFGQAEPGQAALLFPLVLIALGGGLLLVALLLLVRLAALKVLIVLVPVCLICLAS